MVGRPRTGQVVIFPVLGAQRVISVIYTDNGDRDQPIEDIDILSWRRPRSAWPSRTSCCAGRSRREKVRTASLALLRRAAPGLGGVAGGRLVGAGGGIFRLDRDQLLAGLEVAGAHGDVAFLDHGEAVDLLELASPVAGARLQGGEARGEAAVSAA